MYRELSSSAHLSILASRGHQSDRWLLGADGFDCQVHESDGFSDSTILRLTNSFGTFAIRSWPTTSASPLQIGFWEAVNKATPAKRPFPALIPWIRPQETPSSWLAPFLNRWWSIAEWIEGRNVKSDDVNMPFIGQLATVLGALHRQTVLAENSSQPSLLQTRQSSPSLLDRKKSLASLDQLKWKTVLRTADWLPQPLMIALHETLEQLMEKRVGWANFVELECCRERTCHWIVRDLWHGNVMVRHDGSFASIVDLGAARIDWPGLDFIRLFGSLIGLLPDSPPPTDIRALWDTAWNAYAISHPNHSIESLEEVRQWNIISTGLSLIQWLRWIHDEVIDLKSVSQRNKVTSRMNQLCRQYALSASFV